MYGEWIKPDNDLIRMFDNFQTFYNVKITYTPIHHIVYMEGQYTSDIILSMEGQNNTGKLIRCGQAINRDVFYNQFMDIETFDAFKDILLRMLQFIRYNKPMEKLQ